MLNKLLEHSNSKGFDDAGMQAILGIVFAMVGGALLSGLVPLTSDDPVDHCLNVVAMVAIVVGVVFPLTVWILDELIEVVVGYVTDHEKTSEYFITKALLSREVRRRIEIGYKDISYYMEELWPKCAWIFIIGTIILIAGILVALPKLFTIVVLSTVGTIYAIMRLARFSYRLSKKFEKHVNDPNAHNKGES